MNFIMPEQQQQQLLPPSTLLTPLDHRGGGGNADEASSPPANDVNDHLHQKTHLLTKFAFLLSSARGEGSDEPVVGMHHDVEMAACFSERGLGGGPCGGGGGGGGDRSWMMPVTPPSISSSSLSMQSKNGQHATTSRRSTLMGMAAMNMSAPFYTTPDTVSSTAKTILKNIVTTMEELMDSRLRSTVSQLVSKSGGIANSQLLLRLLSPGRDPIQVATVITQFAVPPEGNDRRGRAPCGGELLSIPLRFKAVLDVRILGAVQTVEIRAPATMTGGFDPRDGLLAAVDVSFDCAALLRDAIAKGRALIKTAVTRAAALSVQIAGWRDADVSVGRGGVAAERGTAALGRTTSLHSLLGSGVSLYSLGATSSVDGGATFSDLFKSYSSLSKLGSVGKHARQQQKSGVGRGLLRTSSYSRNTNNAALPKSRNKLCYNDKANATFDFGGGGGSVNHDGNTNVLGLGGRTASTVRFQIPNTYKANNNAGPCPSPSCASTSAPSLHRSQPPQPPAAPQQRRSSKPQPDAGNIHAGLFSWLRDDDMFLTEEKIREQNAADVEHERRLAEAPMPLRFFTAAEDLGGGECGLEMVSEAIFGGSRGEGKRRPQGEDQCQKRRRVW